MLQLKDFMPVNFLKKEKYTGSCKGMRFRMEKFEKEGADAPILQSTPFAMPSASKEHSKNSFSSSGVQSKL